MLIAVLPLHLDVSGTLIIKVSLCESFNWRYSYFAGFIHPDLISGHHQIICISLITYTCKSAQYPQIVYSTSR